MKLLNRIWMYAGIVIFIMFMLFMFRGKKSGVYTTISYLENGKINEERVISDVDSVLGLLKQGIIRNEASLIFSIFSKTKETQYIRDGLIYSSVAKAERQYTRWLKSSKKDRVFHFPEKNYTILNDSTVLFTGIGVIEGNKPWTIAYSILWAQESDGWKALNMHTSWDKK